MGFMSYSLKYYKEKIEYYEQGGLTTAELYKAKQHLKMLDDLMDEGYTSLCDALEAQQNGVSRLRAVIRENQEEPFEMPNIPKMTVDYSAEKYELSTFIESMILKAKKQSTGSENPFLNEMKDFIRWIEYEENTAYIFLLRDTLLPYIYFADQNHEHIYPWLLSRKALESITGKEYVDDDLREAFFDALDSGIKEFDEFKTFVKPKMLSVMAAYPKALEEIQGLLSQIKEERILVIESGCYGTFPMLLAALDERVDIRMFTAVPYMYEIYQNRIFSPAYEKNRYFETLYSQDILMRFAGCVDKKFYVQQAENESAIEDSLAEIKTILGGKNNDFK